MSEAFDEADVINEEDVVSKKDTHFNRGGDEIITTTASLVRT